MRIIVLGFGNVAQPFVKILCEREKELSGNFGLKPRVVAVVDRGGAIVSSSGLNFTRILEAKKLGKSVAADTKLGRPRTTGMEIIEEVEADVVVEATPTNIVDGEPGLSFIKAALKKKRNVIATNKGPLAIALPSLMELARYNGVCLRFSGTVGGGTPLLDLGKKCLLGDKIQSIKGILNGTTNYILARMTEARVQMDDALKEAQAAGYAEADPTYDVKGIDSACKLVILANWLMDRRITIKDVNISGITEVTLNEIVKAEEEKAAIKLIASINGGEASVSPRLLPKNHPLCVGGTLNAVTFTTEFAGEITLVGHGAGGVQTAGAVLRDLIDIKRELSL
ncbi:MAG: homoserine dehydrogenase [Thermoproteota archaeon]|nr:homoserine dehydrogenase [Thermoproteota archaeon]